LTEAEHPHDEQRSDEQQDAVTESGPVTPEPVGEPAAAQEAPAPAPAPEELIPTPVAEQPAAEQPAAEQPAAEQPAAEQPAAEQPAAEVPAPAPAPAAEQPPAAAPAPEAPVPVAQERADEVLEDEVEVAPRQRPEIPGADLIPDIVSETDEFLDAEARAAAEAEAEAAAARDEEESVVEAQPIADAAIDLAAGARYTATGKRKTAVARVIIKPGSGTYSINGKPLDQFFPRETLQRVIRQPLEAVGYESRMDVVARMHGGGVSAQAGALRHGISRALIVADPNLRGELKRRGFLTRDPRVKERKKAGLKKARKRPQFSKR
jgi:small subunit ribosomal protein S9